MKRMNIYRAIFYPFARVDWLLLPVVMALAAVGMVALSSSTGNEGIITRQSWFLGIGAALMIACACVGWRFWKWMAAPVYIGCLALLVAVEFVGLEANNAKRWLDVGPFALQPSELAKIAVPLAVACFYGLFKGRGLWQHAIALALIALPVALVFGQPDLGTSVMIALAGLIVVFLAGLQLWLIASVSIVGAFAAPYVWTAMLKEYQRDRILSVLDPYQDPLGSGYHTIQSSIAVGSGGTWGKGWGLGTQSQLGFLPEKHTDFIFAVYAEEFGFVGGLVLLALIMLVFIRLLLMAGFARDIAGGYLVAAIAMALLVQSLVNLGMVSGLLPVVGLPLPFVSYGGTSILALAMALGIAMSVSKHREEKANKP